MASTATAGRIPGFFLYGETPRAYDERTLHVETIERRSAPRHWKIEPHFHPTLHQLLFVRSGRGTALAECSLRAYRPPALVVVPAGAVHGYEFEPGTEGFVASITDDLPRELALREPGIDTLFDSPAIIELDAEAFEAGDLERSFAMFARELERPARGRRLALEGCVRVILANVLRLSDAFAATSADAALGRRRALVARFRDLIEDEFRDSRSVADYASALNVSESRLRRACLSVTEQSPIQIIHGRIVLEARRELLHTRRTVSEIAYALGFDDPAYFTRFFSQRTGLTPSAFRARGARG